MKGKKRNPDSVIGAQIRFTPRDKVPRPRGTNCSTLLHSKCPISAFRAERAFVGRCNSAAAKVSSLRLRTRGPFSWLATARLPTALLPWLPCFLLQNVAPSDQNMAEIRTVRRALKHPFRATCPEHPANIPQTRNGIMYRLRPSIANTAG